MSDDDDELVEAVEEIQNADPEEIERFDDGKANFVINSETDNQDVDAIDDALEDTGYERDGIMEGPEATLQFVRPTEEEADE